MDILDYSPVPKRFKFMVGQTWKFTVKVNDTSGAINLNSCKITAIITGPQGSKEMLSKDNGISVSADGKVFVLTKDWLNIAKDGNDNVTMNPDLRILPRGEMSLQIFITDEQGTDTIPVFIYIDVIEKPSDSSEDRMNANTTIEVTLNNGVLLGVAAQPISDRIEWRRIGFRIDVRYIGESTWTTWADFSAINKGDTGMSAYELAVQQGFVGTVSEWLTSLKVKDGRFIGLYNATTNSPALSATPAQGILDGDFYRVAVGGIIPFAGQNFTANTVCYEGDMIGKIGNQWFLLKYGYGQMMQRVTEAANSATQAAASATTATQKAAEATQKAAEAATQAAQALASANSAAAVAQGASTARPLVSANTMNFAQAKALPSGLQFARNTVATYVDARGIIRTAKANVCRFTHNPETGESLGILVEESRTNFIKNSNSPYLDGAKFSLIGNTTAPDLSNDAIIFEKKTNLNSYFNFDTDTLSDGIYTRSIFAKRMTTDECILVIEAIGGTTGAGGIILFNLATKTFSGNTTIPLEYGYENYPDGWIRVWVSVEKSSTKIVGNAFYLGGYADTSSSLNRIALWGAQFENGKYSTSLIKTSGTSFTRGNDIPVVKNKVYKKFSVIASGVRAKGWEKNQAGYGSIIGTNNNYLLAGLNPLMRDVNIYDVGGNLASTTLADYALKDTPFNVGVTFSFDDSVQKIVLNGGPISTSSTSSSTFLNNDWYIGCRNGATNYLNGTIKAITIYSRNLTDVELQEVTSNRLSGTSPKSLPSNNDLGSAAFLDLQTILTSNCKVEQTIDGTGASYTRNIRRPYDFYFVVVDSNGGTITSQPPATLCAANTDYPLVINFPVGKAITYAIIPSFD